MSMSNAVAGFRASVNGLHFTNSFPSEPDIVANVPPFGNVTIGDASNGLCGGMVYTTMDVFLAGLPPIPDTSQPAPGSPLFNYIVSRLFASFDIPGGVLKYLDWMNTPDHDTGVWVFIRRGLAWHTIMEEWPKIKADIDGGMLSPMALVTQYSADPSKLGENHQVCAYAYEVDDSNRLTLHLYDPNTESTEADSVQLSMSLANPTHTTPIAHNVDIDYPIRGFFRTTYNFSNPASLEPTTPLASNAKFVGQSLPGPLVPGQVFPMRVIVQNLGGTTWTASGANPFRLGTQDPQDNVVWGRNRVDVVGSVAPGQEATFDFQLTAPNVPGTYHLQWRMVQELVTWFGDFTADLPVVVAPALRTMNVRVQPMPVPVNRAVSVIVTAADAASGAAVAGTVSLDGRAVANTGVAFTMKIPLVRRGPPGDVEVDPVPPKGRVSASGYVTANIDFGV